MKLSKIGLFLMLVCNIVIAAPNTNFSSWDMLSKGENQIIEELCKGGNTIEKVLKLKDNLHSWLIKGDDESIEKVLIRIQSVMGSNPNLGRVGPIGGTSSELYYPAIVAIDEFVSDSIYDGSIFKITSKHRDDAISIFWNYKFIHVNPKDLNSQLRLFDGDKDKLKRHQFSCISKACIGFEKFFGEQIINSDSDKRVRLAKDRLLFPYTFDEQDGGFRNDTIIFLCNALVLPYGDSLCRSFCSWAGYALDQFVDPKPFIIIADKFYGNANKEINKLATTVFIRSAWQYQDYADKYVSLLSISADKNDVNTLSSLIDGFIYKGPQKGKMPMAKFICEKVTEMKRNNGKWDGRTVMRMNSFERDLKSYCSRNE